MNARRLVDNIAKIQVRPFVAPVTPRTQKIFIVEDGMPFMFYRMRTPAGWHRFTQTDKYLIQPLATDGEPEEWEIETYLEHLKPQFRLIVLYRLGEDTWLCYPWNLSDAIQKGWPLDEPRAVYLTRRSIEPFNFITACGPPDNLIFQGIDAVTESQLDRTEFLVKVHHFLNAVIEPSGVFRALTPEIRTSLFIARSEIKRREDETKRRAAEEQKKTLEGRIKYYLEFLGSKLVGWKEFGNNLEVDWTDGGTTRRAIIDRKINTVSAGICLFDRDSDFDLTSLVDVYREKEARDYDNK